MNQQKSAGQAARPQHTYQALPGLGLSARVPEEAVIMKRGRARRAAYLQGCLRARQYLTSHNWGLLIMAVMDISP
jgi:hypothetical protein